MCQPTHRPSSSNASASNCRRTSNLQTCSEAFAISAL
jgi:hypothetical protein